MSYFEKKSESQDGSGNDLTSTTVGPKQALDVNIVAGGTGGGTVDQGSPNSGGALAWPVIVVAYTLAVNHWRSTYSASTTPIIILPASVDRKQIVICNRSTATLYVSFNSTLDSTHFDVAIPRNGYYESPIYLIAGDWWGMWDSADGFATVSSLY